MSAGIVSLLAGAAVAAGGGNSGLVVLSPGAQGALEMVGNSRVEIPAKIVYVNSSHQQAVDTTGSAVLDAPAMYLVGGARFNGQSEFTGTLHKSGAAFADPFAHMLYPRSDSMENFGGWSINSNVTLSPGYYPQGISISGQAKVHMDPGVYIFGGSGLKLTSGSLIGDEVTIIIQGGELELAGNGQVHLSPPSAGMTKGVVIAQSRDNDSQMSLAGGAEMHITGAIYAPNAQLRMVGNSEVDGSGPLMGDLVVADTVQLRGTATIRIGRGELKAISLPALPLFD
ncbi:MAG: hypothetical protein JJU33_00235 [Phycisphaerales bacterium]|nr:hypothetical protein [Phycisphaerales bacterium]